MKTTQVWADTAFYFLVFVLLSGIFLAINLALGSIHSLAGNAVATVLTALVLIQVRWRGTAPSGWKQLWFSFAAGVAALVFLFLLQLLSPLLPVYNFAALRGYEILIAFFFNALVFRFVLYLNRPKTPKKQ